MVTSWIAFREAGESGLITKLEVVICQTMLEAGVPLTAREICSRSGIDQASTMSARLMNLREKGIIRRVGVRLCTITGRTSTTHGLTGSQPNKEKPEACQKVMVKCPVCHGEGRISKREVPEGQQEFNV